MLQRRRGRDSGLARMEGGLLLFRHRFGGSINLNTHLHAVVADGVFERGPPLRPGSLRAMHRRSSAFSKNKRKHCTRPLLGRGERELPKNVEDARIASG